MSKREHLSAVLDEVPLGAVLEPYAQDVRKINTEHGLFWLAHRFEATESDSMDRIRGMGIVATGNYDESLTYSVDLKNEFEKIEQKLAHNASSIATVIVERKCDDSTEKYAFCYTGIVPEQFAYRNSKHSVAIDMPGATGFNMCTIGEDGIHMAGEGKRDMLPLHVSSDRYTDFSLVPSLEIKNAEAHEKNTAHLFNEDELTGKLAELFDYKFTGELLIQIGAIALQSEPQKELGHLLDGHAQICEYLKYVKESVEDHKKFYKSVIARNARIFTASATVGSIPGRYAERREEYEAEYTALFKKYSDLVFHSVPMHQIRYDFRTWPYVDFSADSTTYAQRGLGLKEVQHELDREEKEMHSRIVRCQDSLKPLNALLGK